MCYLTKCEVNFTSTLWQSNWTFLWCQYSWSYPPIRLELPATLVPAYKKKRKTNDSMHWHYGFSPVMNSCHIIYISVSKTSQMKIFFRKRMKSNVSRVCPRHLFCSFSLYCIYEVVMLLIVITFTEPGNHPQSLHSKLFQRILYSDSKQHTHK